MNFLNLRGKRPPPFCPPSHDPSLDVRWNRFNRGFMWGLARRVRPAVFAWKAVECLLAASLYVVIGALVLTLRPVIDPLILPFQVFSQPLAFVLMLLFASLLGAGLHTLYLRIFAQPLRALIWREHLESLEHAVATLLPRDGYLHGWIDGGPSVVGATENILFLCGHATAYRLVTVRPIGLLRVRFGIGKHTSTCKIDYRDYLQGGFARAVVHINDPERIVRFGEILRDMRDSQEALFS